MLSVLFLLLWFSGVPDRLETWSQGAYWTSVHEEEKLLSHLMTPYQSVSLGEKSRQVNLYTNGRYAASFPDDFGDGEVARIVMSQRPDATRILVIGEGSEDLSRFLLPFGIDRMDLVDIDVRLHKALLGRMPALTRQAFGSGRARFIEADARGYVNICNDLYDLVWVRVQDPTTIETNRYFTREFYSAAGRCLKPGGVLTASATGSANYLGPELLETSGSYLATLQSVFRFVLAVPGDQQLFFASDTKDIISGNPEELKERLRQKPEVARGFDSDVLYSWFEAQRLADFRKLLERRGGTINTDVRPAAYFHTLRLWLRFTGGDSIGWLGVLFQRGRFLIPVLVFIIMSLSVVITVLHDRKNPSPVRANAGLFAVATTGLACLSLELILIFGYQNRFGILYQWLGALFALYMAGTVTGAALFYVISKWVRAARLVVISEIWVLAMAGILLFLLEQRMDVQWAFLLCNALIGAAGGFQFASVGAYLLPGRGLAPGLSEISSRMEWADHLGSMIGAAFTAVVLIPVLGITGAILLLIMIKIGSLACTGLLVPSGNRKGAIGTENG